MKEIRLEKNSISEINRNIYDMLEEFDDKVVSDFVYRYLETIKKIKK